MNDRPRNLYVHLPEELDANAYRKRWEAGLEPDESPYGFHNAESLGYRVEYSRSPWNGAKSRGRLGHLRKRATLGLDVQHVWANRHAIERADVVWTMLEQEALAVALLMQLRLIGRKPIIAGTVWVLNEWYRTTAPKRLLFRRLLRSLSIVAVHAEPCLQIAREDVRLSNARLMHFGVSAATFAPIAHKRRNAREKIVIYAIGNDQTRDWGVLFRAFGNDGRFVIKLVCRWVSDEEAAQYSNVDLVRDPDIATMLRLYADADYAAVPMHPNRFSGITVALEAAALGVPILATDTGGLATYFDHNDILLVAPGDATGMKEAVCRQSDEERRQMAERANAKFRKGDYTTSGMMRRYHDLTASLVD